MIQIKNIQTLSRYSLVIVWLFTGITSIFLAPQIGYDILQQANITGSLATFCVLGGGLLDILMGLWLATNIKPKLCYQLQILIIIFFTIALSFIAPSYWLHPFGPVTKNLPIIALILMLYPRQDNRS